MSGIALAIITDMRNCVRKELVADLSSCVLVNLLSLLCHETHQDLFHPLAVFLAIPFHVEVVVVEFVGFHWPRSDSARLPHLNKPLDHRMTEPDKKK